MLKYFRQQPGTVRFAFDRSLLAGVFSCEYYNSNSVTFVCCDVKLRFKPLFTPLLTLHTPPLLNLYSLHTYKREFTRERELCRLLKCEKGFNSADLVCRGKYILLFPAFMALMCRADLFARR